MNLIQFTCGMSIFCSHLAFLALFIKKAHFCLNLCQWQGAKMDRMGFNPVSMLNGPFNRQPKKRTVKRAKIFICEQTFNGIFDVCFAWHDWCWLSVLNF